ncbi:hypothetical protein LTR85_004743 [Meristemomyces frigidus]|nr:hypothetical protein LTR85_004743 [Meristemomyces frigidus]
MLAPMIPGTAICMTPLPATADVAAARALDTPPPVHSQPTGTIEAAVQGDLPTALVALPTIPPIPEWELEELVMLPLDVPVMLPVLEVPVMLPLDVPVMLPVLEVPVMLPVEELVEPVMKLVEPVPVDEALLLPPVVDEEP